MVIELDGQENLFSNWTVNACMYQNHECSFGGSSGHPQQNSLKDENAK